MFHPRQGSPAGEGGSAPLGVGEVAPRAAWLAGPRAEECGDRTSEVGRSVDVAPCDGQWDDPIRSDAMQCDAMLATLMMGSL